MGGAGGGAGWRRRGGGNVERGAVRCGEGTHGTCILFFGFHGLRCMGFCVRFARCLAMSSVLRFGWPSAVLWTLESRFGADAGEERPAGGLSSVCIFMNVGVVCK